MEPALYLSLYERQGFPWVVDQNIVYGLTARIAGAAYVSDLKGFLRSDDNGGGEDRAA